ncbi:MAG: hypothetical protein RL639_666 [Verrucomicrobiota bacterium]|jgi:hypothetical protein
MRTRLLLTIVLASLLAGYAGWWVARDFRKAEACERGSELGWLQAEFRLDDTAVARIGQLQRRFEEECEVHCEQVRQARALMATKPGDESKVRLEAALGKCQASRREHVLAIAACMPPEKGKAYVDLIMPQVEALSHEGAPGLDGHHKAK